MRREAGNPREESVQNLEHRQMAKGGKEREKSAQDGKGSRVTCIQRAGVKVREVMRSLYHVYKLIAGHDKNLGFYSEGGGSHCRFENGSDRI